MTKKSKGASLESLTLPVKLGSGGFGSLYKREKTDILGEIYLGYSKDITHPYAVKTISKKNSEYSDLNVHMVASQKTVEKEIHAGKMLRHKNISQFVCEYEDDETSYLVFEYIPGKAIVFF